MEKLKVKNTLSVRLAKYLMCKFPNTRKKNDLSISEIFKDNDYLKASEEKQKEIKLASANFRYESEPDHCFFSNYFPKFSTKDLKGKTVLDLGCFTGGRIVYWKKKYELGETHAIDIYPIYEEAGKLFSKNKGVEISFKTGFAEDLPYDDDYFELIISYDVFEHVRDVQKVMGECFRVLKPGGRLMVVFPQFLNPLASHLSVTKLPCLHWFFSGSTLAKAANDIYMEKGNDADWYPRESDKLQKWEKLPSLNGIYISKFRKIFRKKNWTLISQNKRPIFGGSTTQQKLPNIIFYFMKFVFTILASIPLIEELFLNRVVFILEKGSLNTEINK